MIKKQREYLEDNHAVFQHNGRLFRKTLLPVEAEKISVVFYTEGMTENCTPASPKLEGEYCNLYIRRGNMSLR